MLEKWKYKRKLLGDYFNQMETLFFNKEICFSKENGTISEWIFFFLFVLL